MKLAPRRSILCLLLLVLLSSPFGRTFAQTAPLDLWSSDTLLTIRDKNTLNYSITARPGYFEVSFDSNNNATWADGARRTRYTQVERSVSMVIWRVHCPADRIRRLLSVTGTTVSGSPEEAVLLAAFGYVALSIDGPGQGLSTGPPDTNQGWISVEEIMNVPAPYVSYLLPLQRTLACGH